MAEQKQPDVILARCTMMLRGNGEVEVMISHLEPAEFLKVAKENSPAWTEAELIAQSIGFVVSKFQALNKELEEYISSLI